MNQETLFRQAAKEYQGTQSRTRKKGLKKALRFTGISLMATVGAFAATGTLAPSEGWIPPFLLMMWVFIAGGVFSVGGLVMTAAGLFVDRDSLSAQFGVRDGRHAADGFGPSSRQHPVRLRWLAQPQKSA